MIASICRYRERLRSASLPWPVLAAVAAAAAAVLLASRATPAEAADLGPLPMPPAAQAAHSVGLPSIVNDAAAKVSPRQAVRATRDAARALVPPVVRQTAGSVTEPVTTTATQAASSLTGDPLAALTLRPLLGGGQPAPERFVRGPVEPVSGAAQLPSMQASAVDLRSSPPIGPLPDLPGPANPGSPGLPPAAISAIAGAAALGSALGIVGGLLILLSTARGQPGPPVPLVQADLRLLVERPG